MIRRYKWTVMFGLLSLGSFVAVIFVFFWGWFHLGLATGFYVLLMIYGYIGFSTMMKVAADAILKIRTGRPRS